MGADAGGLSRRCSLEPSDFEGKKAKKKGRWVLAARDLRTDQ